ncbi:elongation factor P [Patescibacteria group bacterium]|nr:MAG: elongation factor P [Patescibacteria group bacterium]
MSKSADIAKNVVIRENGELFLVTEFQHVNPGKGSAFTRARLKNIRSGKTLEHTYKDSDTVDIVEVERRRMQYLYGDQSGYTFMDTTDYEQVMIPKALLEDRAGYLKEGQEVNVVVFENSPITVDLPRKITLTVTEAAPAVKGDTASGNVSKEAVVETGLKVAVPLFIKEGDRIVINTDSGEYVERG